VPRKQWSLRDWIRNFLQDNPRQYEDYEDEDILPQSDSMPGGDDDFYDDLAQDGILESFIILGLAAALIWLIYYRQQRQLAHRRDEEAARVRQAGQLPPMPQQAQDGGLFPQVGDPDFQQWVVGGVGH
jgi:SEL1 protein